MPQYDDAAAVFSVWPFQLGTSTNGITDCTPTITIIGLPSLTAGWSSRCGTSDTSGLFHKRGCRADYHPSPPPTPTQGRHAASALETCLARMTARQWLTRRRVSHSRATTVKVVAPGARRTGKNMTWLPPQRGASVTVRAMRGLRCFGTASSESKKHGCANIAKLFAACGVDKGCVKE